MEKFYTYIYRDFQEPIYVGRGKANRPFGHLKRTHNKHLGNRLHKMKREGREPQIEVIEAINASHSKFLEVCLIDIFGRRDLGTGTLLNHTGGGDGRVDWSEEQKQAHSLKITGQKRTEETKRKMSMSAKKIAHLRVRHPTAGMTGKVHSEETKEKMRAHKKPKTQQHREKLAAAQAGKKHSEETKAKIKASWERRRLLQT